MDRHSSPIKIFSSVNWLWLRIAYKCYTMACPWNRAKTYTMNINKCPSILFYDWMPRYAFNWHSYPISITIRCPGLDPRSQTHTQPFAHVPGVRTRWEHEATVWHWTGHPFRCIIYYILNHVHVPPVNWFNRNFIRKDELFFFIIGVDVGNIACLFGLGVPPFDSSTTLFSFTIFGLFPKFDSRSLWMRGCPFGVLYSTALYILYILLRKGWAMAHELGPDGTLIGIILYAMVSVRKKVFMCVFSGI